MTMNAAQAYLYTKPMLSMHHFPEIGTLFLLMSEKLSPSKFGFIGYNKNGKLVTSYNWP